MKFGTRAIKALSAVVAAGLISGCATVTISPKDQAKLESTPDYENSLDFFFWGLAPAENEVAVDEICGSEPRQMQAQTTFVDGLIGGLTLGIYAPRTVKVWCEG